MTYMINFQYHVSKYLQKVDDQQLSVMGSTKESKRRDQELTLLGESRDYTLFRQTLHRGEGK